MSFTEKRLCNPTTLNTVGTTLYTVPSSKTTIIKQLVVTNTTASAKNFDLYIGSATTANAVFKSTNVAANDSIIINLSQVLSSDEILTGIANANSSLNITISGVENDGPLNPVSTYIADDAITTAKIANSSITMYKLASNSVITSVISNSAITQAKLDNTISLSGIRNIIINGDMRINQRVGPYTTVGYTLDRWYLGVTGAYTVSQSNSSPPTNFQNFMRVQRTNGSANTTVPQLAQSLETRDSIPLQGKQITVSFYARAGANYSPSGSLLNWRVYGGTGTDQNVFSYTGQAIPVDQSVTLTTSWQRFTYTVSSLTSYNEYGLFFFCSPTGTAGANDYFDITGVQMEIGLQPTPFEQRPYQFELALCQRYFERLNVDNLPRAIGYTNFNTAVYNCYVMIRTTQKMRTNVSVSASTGNTSGGIFNTVQNTSYTNGGLNYSSLGDQGFFAFTVNAVGSANGQMVVQSGTTYDISAEL